MAGPGAKQATYPGSYILAYDLARLKLRGRNADGIRRSLTRCGGAFLSAEEASSCLGNVSKLDKDSFAWGAAKLAYLGRECILALPEGDSWIREPFGPKFAETPLWLKIVLLHYLVDSSGDGLTGELVPFRSLSGGALYEPNFEKRSLVRLAREYGNDLKAFISAGKTLGGQEADYGDAAVTLELLPRVPVVLVLWGKDEEFSSEARALFDSSVSSYLPTEDVIVLCQEAVGEMLRASRRSKP